MRLTRKGGFWIFYGFFTLVFLVVTFISLFIAFFNPNPKGLLILVWVIFLGNFVGDYQKVLKGTTTREPD